MTAAAASQPGLWEPDGGGQIREYQAGRCTLRARAGVFAAFWQFAARRQDIYHQRAAGLPPPWTSDPFLARHRFTNVYRGADRTSQYLINQVIYAAPAAQLEEAVFRILLFKIMNSAATWQLLESAAGPVSWRAYDFRAYDEILTAALARGDRIYSPAYIIPDPPFGEHRKHRNHLRLLEVMMSSGLPATIAACGGLAAAYQALRAYPSIGPFLGYQFAVDLAYSPVLDGDENAFVVPGPGCLDGVAKCFADTGGLTPADVIRWISDTAPAHFAEHGLIFRNLWGRDPSLTDWQNVFCEVSKITRLTHPDVPGLSGRTRIKQQFTAAPRPVTCRFPPKWRLPATHTAAPR